MDETNKIADLSEARGKRSPELQWSIPAVYRITGFEFDEMRGEEVARKIASKRPALPRYTLFAKDKDAENLANPKIERVCCLDPKLDQGWVVVRQHDNHDRAYGYAQKEVDHFMVGLQLPTSCIFDTSQGPYTLTHYPIITRTTYPLIVYIRTHPGASIDDLTENEMSATQYAIYHPDGTITYDPSLLFPEFKD